VYAYALTLLAPHEKTLDWARLARGILVSGQAMQYPEGPLIGCLPDAFHLSFQQRLGPSINPCALASLEMALEGEVDSLCVAVSAGKGGHRVLAPFPVRFEGAEAVIEGRAGTRYQVLIDGTRIVDIVSEGVDRVPVE
jgi:hypothetical protein